MRRAEGEIDRFLKPAGKKHYGFKNGLKYVDRESEL